MSSLNFDKAALNFSFNVPVCPTNIRSAITARPLTQTQTATVSAIVGGTADLVSSAPWLTCPASVDFHTPFNVAVDCTLLPHGSYVGKITASADGFDAAELTINVAVLGDALPTRR